MNSLMDIKVRLMDGFVNRIQFRYQFASVYPFILFSLEALKWIHVDPHERACVSARKASIDQVSSSSLLQFLIQLIHNWLMSRFLFDFYPVHVTADCCAQKCDIFHFLLCVKLETFADKIDENRIASTEGGLMMLAERFF